MKKTSVLNSRMSAVISEMGHTDSLCIADAGLPIPGGPERIDLAVRPGLPGFMDVLATVMEELVVERALLAEEIREKNPDVLAGLMEFLPGVPFDFVPHEEFKAATGGCRAVVRTGECTPYANVILYSGVAF